MRFEEFKDMLKSGDLEQIRPHLAFEMMSADSPKTERYNDCPYIAIQDMYAIPIIWASLDDHDGSLAKKPFTRELCGYFGIGCGEAIRLVQDEVAKKALPVCELQSFMNQDFEKGMSGAARNEALYVATTKDFFYGAGVICTYHFLQDAEKRMGGSYYILPSSVHEWMIVKEDNVIEPKQYLEMVRAVNHNPYAVNESEHLTDNAYHYDAKTKQLETAEEYEARLEKERTEKRRSHYSRKKEKQQEREEPEEEEELER